MAPTDRIASTAASNETRLQLLEQTVDRHERILAGSDGESGLSGRMRRMETFQARIGGMATAGALLGGMIAGLVERIILGH